MAVKVCTASELDAEQAVRVVVDGAPIVVVKDADGCAHALGDTCSHADISLAEGFVEGSSIECWAHGARFSLATGEALTLPATEPVPVYGVHIVNGDVYIDTDTDGAAPVGADPSTHQDTSTGADSCTHACAHTRDGASA